MDGWMDGWNSPMKPGGYSRPTRSHCVVGICRNIGGRGKPATVRSGSTPRPVSSELWSHRPSTLSAPAGPSPRYAGFLVVYACRTQRRVTIKRRVGGGETIEAWMFSFGPRSWGKWEMGDLSKVTSPYQQGCSQGSMGVSGVVSRTPLPSAKDCPTLV